MTRTIRKAFLYVISSKVSILAIGLLFTPVLTRLLGARLYGVLATVLAIYAITEIFFTSGVNVGIKKFLAENRSEPHWKDDAFGFYFKISLALTLAGALGYWTLAYFGVITSILGGPYVILIYLVGAILIISQASEFFLRALMGLQLEHISESLRIIRQVSFVAVAIGLLLAGYAVEGVLLAKIVGSFVVVLVAGYYLSKTINLPRAVSPTSSDFPKRELLTYNFAAIIYVFFLTTLYHVDVILLRLFTTETDVGYYKAALMIAGFLWLAPRAAQDVLVQSTSEYWRIGAVERVNEISTRISRYAFLFTALLAIGVAVLADPFVPLYFGSEFSPAVLPLLILLPGAVGFAIARPLLAITHATGQLKPLVIVTGFVAITNFVLNLILIPIYGTVGAAVATSVGYGLLPIGNVLIARYIGYKPYTGAGFDRIILTSVLTLPILYVIALAIPGLLVMVLVPPIGALIFIALAIFTGAIPHEDVATVLRIAEQNDFVDRIFSMVRS